MLALASVLAGESGVFGGFRRQATDALFPSSGLDPRVVVVGIDQQSIAEVGLRWPWPRDVQADLVRRVADAGPAVLVVDVVHHPATPSDVELGDALRAAGETVVAAAPELRRGGGGRVLSLATLTEPAGAVAAGADAVGVAAITPDPADGVVRSVPLVLEGPDRAHVLGLSLAAVARLERLPSAPTLRPGGVQLGDRFVPTGRHARLAVNYVEELVSLGGARYVSAADLLRGRVQRGRLRDKLVLVGVTDPTLGDHHPVPPVKASGIPGVLVHANAVNTVLTRAYLHPASDLETAAWVGVMAFLVAFAGRRARLWLAGALAGALVVAYVALTVVRFDQGKVLDVVFPLAGLALALVTTLVARYVTEVRRRRAAIAALEQYVPAITARHLLARAARRGLPTGTLTFLFTDVVGSTRAWEAWPQQMSEAMRRHDVLVDSAVDNHGGAVVRPRGEGDSRFCVFVRAADGVAAAVAIDRALAGEAWPTPQPLRVRMALHTGGAELRDGDYYGSPVNRCARIRATADPGQILLSAATVAAVGDDLPDGVTLVDLGDRILKDFDEPERVSAVVAR